MTSRGVLYSLRSIRFNRVLFNGRRGRFLDSVAYYSNNRCPESLHRKWTPTQMKAFNTDSATLSKFHCSNSVVEMDTEFSLEISSDGRPLANDRRRLIALATSLQEDAMLAMKELVYWHQTNLKRFMNKEVVELSLILSDDEYIQDLNRRYLNEDSPTDVLSFPMDGDEDDDLPIMLLGDIVISLDRADRQASEMGHNLLTECRILLVHGLLHLFGYDHDRDQHSWDEMAKMERMVMNSLGWKGQGLISDAKRVLINSVNLPRKSESKIGSGFDFEEKAGPTISLSPKEDKIKLVALDLDGTLLTSDQKISESAREAINEAIARGIRVIVATGKSRPAVYVVGQKFGLFGQNSLISPNSAGLFLQGLVVHTVTGKPIEGPNLSHDVVKSAFEYAEEKNVSCVAFTGDECSTLKLTPELLCLHKKYYEPLAAEMDSIQSILEGPPVKKIILMADPEAIKNELGVEWESRLRESGAQTTIAVSSMLELVPRGINKWVGLQSLSKSMNLSHQSIAAVGDGLNDLEMIKNAAVGVAMGNAVDQVKSVADFVVNSNDDDGIAEAFEKYILD